MLSYLILELVTDLVTPTLESILGGRLGEERELEPVQFLLLEQGIEKERFTESGSEVTGAERVDAVLRTIESMGRNVISSDEEEALLRQITVSNSSGPSTSKARNTK